MSGSNIIFDANAVMGMESSLRGYLFVDPSSYDEMDAGRYVYDSNAFDATWTFEMVLARLNSIANQIIFDDGNFDKSSFKVNGTFKGQFFDLYDYKGDRCVHIGGGADLDVNGLIAELSGLVKEAQPKPFTSRCSYTYQKYRYP
jgi:hypothetical protein